MERPNEDYIHQMTLNLLINKNQLQKLNQKTKETKDKDNERQRYATRIESLFQLLLHNDPPDDVMVDVSQAFDYFCNKSLYYLKMKDYHDELDRQKEGEDDIKDDIDFDREEQAIANGCCLSGSEDEDEEEVVEEDKDGVPIQVEDECKKRHPVNPFCNNRNSGNPRKVSLNWFGVGQGHAQGQG